jgi:hypothetical protein
MIQRRWADLGLRVKIGCHTFRATGITAYSLHQPNAPRFQRRPTIHPGQQHASSLVEAGSDKSVAALGNPPRPVNLTDW